MDRGARWATAHVVTKSLKYYSATKKKEIISFATKWMQLETVILSEISQKRERQIVYDITYIWNLKYGTDEPIYETETDSWAQRTDLQLLSEGEGWSERLGLADVNYYI